MSPVKVQFNSSTLKASYNLSNSKAQVMDIAVGGPCTNCVNDLLLPVEITLLIENAVDCECLDLDPWCPLALQDIRSTLIDGDVASLVNGTHVLTQDPPSFGSACVWRKVVEIEDGLEIKLYRLVSDCSNSPYRTYTMTQIDYTISRAATVLHCDVVATFDNPTPGGDCVYPILLAYHLEGLPDTECFSTDPFTEEFGCADGIHTYDADVSITYPF